MPLTTPQTQQRDDAGGFPGSVPYQQEYDEPKMTTQSQYHTELLESRGEIHRGEKEWCLSNSYHPSSNNLGTTGKNM